MITRRLSGVEVAGGPLGASDLNDVDDPVFETPRGVKAWRRSAED
jgi:hypothetical protein